MQHYEKEMEIAIRAVTLASHFCAEVREDLVTEDTLTKKDRSPVTVADFGSQAIVNQALREHFSHDIVVGEEDAAALRHPEQAQLAEAVLSYVGSHLPGLKMDDLFELIDHGCGDPTGADRFWTLDPIDGTKGFLRDDQYAVALALIENGEVVAGVLGCPNLSPVTVEDTFDHGALFYAARGQGSRCLALSTDDITELTVDPVSDPAAMTFCESVESGHSAHGRSARIAELLGVSREPVRLDSQAKYAIVARGEAAAYLRLPTSADYQEKIWDHGAGYIVVEEAGGKITDVAGKPLDFSQGRTLAKNRGVVATNGHVHEAVIEAIGAVIG